MGVADIKERKQANLNKFEMSLVTYGETVVIFTLGHSNVPASKIIELLTLHNIQTVVDVRSSPYSQFSPQFNREVFEQTLKLSGIDYKYAGDYLGGRPKDPTCYKNGEIPEGHADFLHLVDYTSVMTKDFFLKGIQRLIALASESRVAVMCSEEDPATCHRHHLIGRYLTRQGITVRHIRGDGNLVKDQHLPNLKNDPPPEQPTLF